MRKYKFLILAFLILLFILNLVKSIYIFNYKYHTEKVQSRMNCMVIKKEKEEEEKISYVVKYNSNKFILNVYMDKYDKSNGDLSKFCNYTYGDIITFRGNITIPQKLNNPYEFDYKRYLNSNNIVGTITTYNAQKVDRKIDNILLYIGSIIRENIDIVVDEKMSFEEASLFKSMIYGNDVNLSYEISNSFKENGISHMLAISGLHMMYVIKIINIITKDMNNKVKISLNFLFILIFCIISSMSMSVIRAAIMSIITLMDRNSKNDSKAMSISSYKKLLIAFVILIIYNPYNILNLGFQMSFIATFGIIAYSSTIKSFFEIKLKINKKYLYIIETFSLSLSSSIVIFPLQIYYFGKFELISFVSNIFLSIIMSFEFLIGFLSIFLCFIPFISDILVTSNYIILKTIINATKYISSINYFTLYIPKFNYLELFLMYATILIHTTKKYIPAIFNKKRKKIVRKIITLVTVVTFVYIISMYTYRKYFEEFIYFFNVEQGNMAIIKSKRKVIVIDIGSTNKNLSARVLKNFLDAKAINKIDVICITHMHEDHVNGIYEIAEYFNIKNVLYSVPLTTEKGEYEKFENLLNEKKITKIQVKKGDVINISDVRIDVLMPLEKKKIIAKDMLNSNSSIYLITKDGKNYLFMGDATLETENELLKNIGNELKERLKKITAIQIGHHGSKTSSSENFIQNINPCIAIISSKKEKFNHPNKEVIDILEKYNFDIKITEKERSN